MFLIIIMLSVLLDQINDCIAQDNIAKDEVEELVEKFGRKV